MTSRIDVQPTCGCSFSIFPTCWYAYVRQIESIIGVQWGQKNPNPRAHRSSGKRDLPMNKWLFHQNRFTRTSFSATVTRVSNFLEENVCLCVCVFLHRQGSPSRWIQSLIVQHNRLNMSIAMYSARSKH